MSRLSTPRPTPALKGTSFRELTRKRPSAAGTAGRPPAHALRGQVPPSWLVDRARSPSRGQVPAGRLVDRAGPPSGGQVPAGRLVDRAGPPSGGQVPAGRLVDRARSPSGGQVPAGRLVDRARSPSGGQVPAGRLVDPSLRGRKGARKGCCDSWGHKESDTTERLI